MTYAELVQKIRDYTEVGSEVLTATIVDGFIRDAELKTINLLPYLMLQDHQAIIHQEEL